MYFHLSPLQPFFLGYFFSYFLILFFIIVVIVVVIVVVVVGHNFSAVCSELHHT